MVSTQVEGSPPALDGEEFREAMSLLAAPLTIVTARDTEGRPWGFTASSVTSVSLEPPLVLVGMSHTSSCFPALSEAAEFTINVLGSDHRDLARTFATSGVDRFSGVSLADWLDSTVPYLADVAVAFRCTATSRIPVGDHTLLIGELTGMRGHGATASPLVWYRRDFRMSI
ncbi:NADH:riboflavin 5'-phosphate oxidoreductase [Streptomyces sp. SA15]|uniref:flavin reductase family protein n=1 Tax=Streptomyces sp. SA15 TaxID=934019 RepID=UPI000BAE9ACB|nr:flavin reductase family protein [Streptomyces sp. SA15]PAZ17601.1 NADH:riboflavin 5'-phosphate oxidoreductase [Streptomyces sp. SA15]